jgi:hypothetical protein
MSSDADLSTGDLAEPGRDRPDMSGSEGQLSDRRAEPASSAGDQSPDGPGENGTERAQPQGGQGRDDGTMAAPGGGTRQGGEGTRGTEATGPAAGASAAGGEDADVALLDPADGQRFRQRWSDVQARFVDDPRAAVQTADSLVAELMQSLAGSFNEHKGRLESAWQSGDDPDTEELRQALQRYRSFFDRLLST